MVRKSIFSLVCAVLAAQSLFLTGCKNSEGEAAPEQQQPAMPAPLVTAERVEASIPETVKKYVGTFEAIETVDVVARVAGKITEMNVEEGKNVQAGEQLFKIEDTVYKANLASAAASVATSEANIKTSEANLKSATAAVEDLEAKLRYAINNYLRNTRLYCGDNEALKAPFTALYGAELNSETILGGLKKINEVVANIEIPTAAVSKDSYENAETTVKSAVAALESARAAMQAAEGTLGSARASLDVAKAKLELAEFDNKYTVVTSDISGRVGRTNTTLGNYVTPASGALITVTQMSPVYVRFSMSEQDFAEMFGNVQNMQDSHIKVEVQLLNKNPNGVNEEEKTKFAVKTDENGKNMIFLDNSVHTNMGAVYLWATIDNEHENFNPGGLCRVIVTKFGAEKCAFVRNTAIQHDPQGTFVYVVGNGNLVEMRRVKLGPATEQYQALMPNDDLTQTVREGEVVVTTGTHKIIMMPGVQPKVDLALPSGLTAEQAPLNVTGVVGGAPAEKMAAAPVENAPAQAPAEEKPVSNEQPSEN